MIRLGECRRHDPDSEVPDRFEFEVHDSAYREAWAEGVSIFHNPRAAFPLDPDNFPGANIIFWTRWRLVVESLPQAQLRKLIESLPSEQMRTTLESLPSTQLRKALKALPTEQMREALARLDRPAKQIEKILKTTNDTQSWIEKSGFTSSRALTKLIDRNVPADRKKNR